MDIRFGAEVAAEDGRVGRVERVILHPETAEVVGVVVAGDDLLPTDVIVPSDWITSAEGDLVRVRGTREDVGALEPFAQSQYVLPPEEWIPPTNEIPDASIYLFPAPAHAVEAFQRPISQRGPAVHEVADLAEGDVDVTGSTRVFCRDGEVGRVEEVVTKGNSDRVSHLIVRQGRFLLRDVAIPVTHLGEIRDGELHLNLTRSELDSLPDPQEIG
jgi:sporulation protein YlmC with PRC-barrel domain